MASAASGHVAFFRGCLKSVFLPHAKGELEGVATLSNIPSLTPLPSPYEGEGLPKYPLRFALRLACPEAGRGARSSDLALVVIGSGGSGSLSSFLLLLEVGYNVLAKETEGVFYQRAGGGPAADLGRPVSQGSCGGRACPLVKNWGEGMAVAAGTLGVSVEVPFTLTTIDFRATGLTGPAGTAIPFAPLVAPRQTKAVEGGANNTGQLTSIVIVVE